MAEQYPLNAAEAFLGTAGCWFDTDALARYAEKAREPSTAFDFVVADGRARRRSSPSARTAGSASGTQPEKGSEYALYVDVATGRGKDYTSDRVST